MSNAKDGKHPQRPKSHGSRAVQIPTSGSSTGNIFSSKKEANLSSTGHILKNNLVS